MTKHYPANRHPKKHSTAEKILKSHDTGMSFEQDTYQEKRKSLPSPVSLQRHGTMETLAGDWWKW